jgi:hypothetical protein
MGEKLIVFEGVRLTELHFEILVVTEPLNV